MKKTVTIIAISCAVLLAGCSEQANESETQQAAAQPATQAVAPATTTAPAAPAHPPMSGQHTATGGHPAAPGHNAPPAGDQYQASVISVMHAAGYTYIEVEANGKSTWVAASPVNAKKGDTITWSGGATMHNFTSKSLRKTFPEIIFVDQVSVAN